MQVILSLVQFDAGVGRPEENLARAREEVLEAGRRRSDLVLLPELWQDGLDYARAGQLAVEINRGAFLRMKEMAREASVHLAGSAFERDHEGVFNTLALYSPTGELLATYRKIHLFPLMHEDRYLKGGNEARLVSLPWGKVGLTVCYDLRFPELFRRLALNGAEMILLPAQWPYQRLDHWRALIHARAIENQLFFVGCNRAGWDGEVRFAGHSVVRDPWGERLVEGGAAPVLLTVSINRQVVSEVRRRIPAFEGRREETY